MTVKQEKVWSIDVVLTPVGWVVRRAGSMRTIRIFPYRKLAIEHALNIKTAFYVWVFTRDGAVQYVKRTRVRR